jgi:hypothetical protein
MTLTETEDFVFFRRLVMESTIASIEGSKNPATSCLQFRSGQLIIQKSLIEIESTYPDSCN